MKPEDKLKLKEQLVRVYEGYIKDIYDKEIMNSAQKLFFDYIYNQNIPDREFMIALHGLEHIGWEFSRGLQTPNSKWKMSQQDAREIVAKLK